MWIEKLTAKTQHYSLYLSGSNEEIAKRGLANCRGRNAALRGLGPRTEQGSADYQDAYYVSLLRKMRNFAQDVPELLSIK